MTGPILVAALALGAVYLAQVARLTLFADTGYGHLNLVPFRTIGSYLGASDSTDARNLVGNVMMLVPLGILLATVTRLRPGRAALTLIAVSAAIEVLQWLLPTNRSVDIDDVILNSVGGTAGYALGLGMLWVLELIAPSAINRQGGARTVSDQLHDVSGIQR